MEKQTWNEKLTIWEKKQGKGKKYVPGRMVLPKPQQRYISWLSSMGYHGYSPAYCPHYLGYINSKGSQTKKKTNGREQHGGGGGSSIKI